MYAPSLPKNIFNYRSWLLYQNRIILYKRHFFYFYDKELFCFIVSIFLLTLFIHILQMAIIKIFNLTHFIVLAATSLETSSGTLKYFLVLISLGRVWVTSTKIVIKLPRTYEKLPCKVEPYQSSGQGNPSVQPDTHRSCYFYIRISNKDKCVK